LTYLRVKYFEGLYKELERVNMDDNLKLFFYFPMMINEDLNEYMFRPMNKEKLIIVLQ
jgi:hypothetical protein